MSSPHTDEKVVWQSTKYFWSFTAEQCSSIVLMGRRCKKKTKKKTKQMEKRYSVSVQLIQDKQRIRKIPNWYEKTLFTPFFRWNLNCSFRRVAQYGQIPFLSVKPSTHFQWDNLSRPSYIISYITDHFQHGFFSSRNFCYVTVAILVIEKRKKKQKKHGCSQFIQNFMLSTKPSYRKSTLPCYWPLTLAVLCRLTLAARAPTLPCGTECSNFTTGP